MVTGAKSTGIEADSVLVEKDGETENIPYDWVVTAAGAESRDYSDLEQKCQAMGIPFFVMGDALEARRALEANAEAAHYARIFDTV